MYMGVVECVSRHLVHPLHSQQVLQWVPLPPTLAHLPLHTPHPKLDIFLLLLGTHHLLPEVTHTLLEDKYASLLQP